MNQVIAEVSRKVVKLFGAGGVRGLANYGVGILISKDGYVLSTASPMLDTDSVVAHLPDGRRLDAKVIATEPLLDVTLLKLQSGSEVGQPLEFNFSYFDIDQAIKQPRAKPGDWVLGFGNTFEIAMRDEAVSVQRGVISAIAPLKGRRGIFSFSYQGDVYLVDAIMNNPGNLGGPLTDYQGNLLGLIGRELRSELSETWINYSIPIDISIAAVPDKDQPSLTIGEFVHKAKLGEYRSAVKREENSESNGYHGIVFVPNLLRNTPPFVEAVRPNSPAEKAGIQPDDLIVFVDGAPTVSVNTFNSIMRSKPIDKPIKLEIRRKNELVSITLTLTKASNQ